MTVGAQQLYLQPGCHFKIEAKQKFCQVQEPKPFMAAGCCSLICFGLPCTLRSA